MSAAIIALPTARSVPVLQRPRRGRLPGSVPNIAAIRIERERKRKAQTAANVEQVKKLCYRTLERALRGEVTGLATIEARSQGPRHSHAAGEFAHDFDALRDAIEVFGEMVTESMPMEVRS